MLIGAGSEPGGCVSWGVIGEIGFLSKKDWNSVKHKMEEQCEVVMIRIEE